MKPEEGRIRVSCEAGLSKKQGWEILNKPSSSPKGVKENPCLFKITPFLCVGREDGFSDLGRIMQVE